MKYFPNHIKSKHRQWHQDSVSQSSMQLSTQKKRQHHTTTIEDIDRWYKFPYAVSLIEHQNVFDNITTNKYACVQTKIIFSPVRNVLMGWTISVFLCQTKVDDVYLCASEQQSFNMDFHKKMGRINTCVCVKRILHIKDLICTPS